VGVEPTIRPAKGRIAGFEGREDHRIPFASVLINTGLFGPFIVNCATPASQISAIAKDSHLQGTRENWVFPEGGNCRYINNVTIGTADLRILIVDDSETTRRILRAIVHSRDWKVCGEADTGRSGITKFQELKPDLVLIDLAMPDINGIEAAKRMSTLNPRVPLILFTVLDLHGLEKAALEAGIWAIVSKAQAWNLIKTIETAVGTFGGASAS
jgi:two-component system, chemotaxis family, chemotaxis protein CheY